MIIIITHGMELRVHPVGLVVDALPFVLVVGEPDLGGRIQDLRSAGVSKDYRLR